MLIIGIAGGTGSGKTTVVKRIMEKLDKGLLDFAVLAETPDAQRHESLAFPESDEWGIVMPEDDPLASKKVIQVDDLIGLHELESTLVYFATGLSGNSNVLNRLTRYERIEQYPEDKDLLGDVIVENQQAMEMTQIYQGIIDSTRDLMSTILDKRLNNVMKILTSITLILAIPTVISGLYGMNVNGRGMPFAAMVNGFGIICLIILAICAVLFFLLRRLRML